VWGQAKPENLPANFFTPPLTNLARKNPNFAEFQPTRHQSEACNFETAQHINKQITDVSSTTNALKHDTKLGSITPTGFFCNLVRKL